MKQFRALFLLLVTVAMVASACGDSEDTTPETVVVTVQVPGDTVQVPGDTVTKIEERIVPGETITFWSTETNPERLAITQGIIDKFTAETSVNVTLVATAEDQLPELMITNAASGTLPDVVFHPIDFTIGWAANGLLDTNASQEVVNELGADTFSAGALDLGTYEGNVAAVPSDGWGQLLIYRKDLFDAAGLDKPDTFAKIEAAAAELHDPGNNFFGITASTDGGAVFTQQTFEHFALANGCELIDDGGTVTLDSANCVEAIEFYTNMMENYSPGGVQDVVTTRATYFAGQAAMIVWSPFILDEMAGLRDSAFPSCAECTADPAFLAKNSDFVPSFAGPSGAPAQYGQVSLMGITTGADTGNAQAFVKYWLSEGYLDWLSTSPEGKFPLRKGNADNATAYVEGWQSLSTGVDRQAQLTDFYPEDIISALVAGTDGFSRWGFTQGAGELVAAVYTSLPVPRVIRDVLDGALDAAGAAAEAQAAAEEEQLLLQD
ncbi:MAG: extracellular solute-binding protein [Acidimicrobiia bacterium]|nr:extracellular solute-binding protein [Acidimicrobiia bacterium]